MAFNPAHKAIVLYALDTAPIDETASPATLPAIPGSPVVLGYTNLPQTSRGLNNSKGFALGQQGAAYNKRGAVQPQLEIEIRPGSVGALANLFPNSATGELPYLCLYVVVEGQYTDVYRKVKPSQLEFKWADGGGQGGELTVSATLMATAYQRTSAITVSTAAKRALGTPLMWHDVHGFSIENAAGTAVDYRKSVMSVSATINYNLERKNQRPNWGDHVPLSRTSYALLEHHVAVSGEITLHERLPESLFTAAATSQDWGDISIVCSDSVLGTDDTKGFTLTLNGAFPSDESMKSAESTAEIDHTITFTADTVSFVGDAA